MLVVVLTGALSEAGKFGGAAIFLEHRNQLIGPQRQALGSGGYIARMELWRSGLAFKPRATLPGVVISPIFAACEPATDSIDSLKTHPHCASLSSHRTMWPRFRSRYHR